MIIQLDLNILHWPRTVSEGLLSSLSDVHLLWTGDRSSIRAGVQPNTGKPLQEDVRMQSRELYQSAQAEQHAPAEDHEAQVSLCPAAWALWGRQIQAAGRSGRTGADPRSTGGEEAQRSALHFTVREISIRAFSGRRQPTQTKGRKEC